MERGGYLGLTAQALALLVVLYGPLGPLPILLCPDLFHVWLTYMNFITKAPGLAGIGLANGRHQQEIKVRRRKTSFCWSSPQALLARAPWSQLPLGALFQNPVLPGLPCFGLGTPSSSRYSLDATAPPNLSTPQLIILS